MESRPPSASKSELTRWMGIPEANTAGNVHGGTIMKLCDEVAGIAAIRHSGLRVVSAGMDRMTFRHPVFVGELVTVRATVNAAWGTSMEVGVRVEKENLFPRGAQGAQPDRRSGEHRSETLIQHTSTAYLTMVALDEDRRPAPVPPLVPETPEEERRAREAQLRRDNRLAERDEIAAGRGGED